MRVLAIDYGAKRIGLALCDELEITTRGAGVIRRGSAASTVAQIAAVAEREGVEQIVAGLPLNMDGSEGPAALAARAFAEELSQAMNRPVALQDERLTSAEAEEWMIAEKKSPKDRKRFSDEYAARVILQDYLASRQKRA